ncbi:MAG: 50S ribosomal protein L34 [Candidatus Gracilibacteria bacterium]
MLAKLKQRPRVRTHGFRSRSASVLNSRRKKGRKQLTVKTYSK